MVTLTGRLVDITTAPVEEVTEVRVKAPAPRTSGDVITTQPKPVTVTPDGTITFTVGEGIGWIYIDGDGWSDSIRFIAAAGMQYVWEAIVNAQGVPGFMDYLGIISGITGRLDDEAKRAVERNAEQIKWNRGRLATLEITADGMREDYEGVWGGSARDAGLKRLPEAANGQLTVKVTTRTSSGSVYVMQSWVTETGNVWTRWFDTSQNQWSEWVRDGAREGRLATLEITADGMREDYEGVWGGSARDAGLKRLPEAANGQLTVKVTTRTSSGSVYVMQSWVTETGNVWTRWFDTSQNQWSEWVSKTNNAAASAISENRHEALIASRGGRIGTSGKAAVSLRFDHNLAPFDEKILPLLRQRALPATMPCFAEMMAPQPGYNNDNSTGKTWEDVNSNFQRGIEVFSHSTSHIDTGTIEGLTKEIVESRTTLEAQIPDTRVHGFAQPGVSGTRYDGWLSVANDPSNRAGHYVGGLLTATYGTWNTGSQGFNEIGKIPTRHVTIEKMGLAEIKKQVDLAVSMTLGITLMLHPSLVDTSGNISSATLAQVFDYLVELRDAGQIMVLSQGGQAVADPASSWRHSLTPGVSGWSGSPTKKIAFTVPLSNIQDCRGGMREFVAEVTGTGKIKLSATADDIMDVYQTVDVAPGKPGRLQIGVPRRANSLTLTAEVTSGSPKITNIGLYGV